MARSTRSTPRRASSKCWSTCSGARRRSSSTCFKSRRSTRSHGQEEGPRDPQARATSGPRHAGAAGGHGARPARHQHHGVHEGLQRAHAGPGRRRRSGRDHDLRRPILHIRPQDPADREPAQAGGGRGEGLGEAEPREDRPRHQAADPDHRRDEAQGPQRVRDRGRHEDDRGHRPVDGPGGSRVVSKRHGKKYVEAAKKVEAAVAANGNGGLTPGQAVALAKDTSISKFDATVEAHIRLGVDPRHAEQMVRGSVVLPNGTGKKVRVAVFAVGDKAREAQEAGADFVGGEDLVKKVSEGWTDFDAAVATPDMMSRVGPLGKILGPRGLMPNPKSGTVTQDVARAVREVKGGKVEFRTDKFGIVHAPIGKVSFDQQQLHQNLTALVDALIRNKPSTSKGQYLRTFYLAATQGPSVPVDVKEAAKLHTSS